MPLSAPSSRIPLAVADRQGLAGALPRLLARMRTAFSPRPVEGAEGDAALLTGALGQAAPGGPTTAEQAALDALPDPLLLVEGTEPDDLTGRRIGFANAAARRLLRIPQAGALLVSAIRSPEVLEAIDESLFGAIPSETTYQTGGAQERVWRVRTVPLTVRGLNPAGESTRMALAHLRDETDGIRAEQMRVDFLANASHELRTPLASLAGFIETLRGHARDDPEARDQFLRIMSAQAERMSRLIDDLMSLSRIELNEHIPPQGSCDLALCVMDVADTLRPMTTATGVALAFDLPGRGIATVAGDRDQITQVVQNLIDNALKYSGRGQTVDVAITVGLSREAAAEHAARAGEMAAAGGGRLPLLTPDRGDDDRYVLLSVTDHGPGMMREHLPRLTERFFRVEGQKSGLKLGTGLGLAIVKHIMNRHRGGMVVESAPGRGATFAVYFPAD
jgi:two-component system phosphate regulon sensor histidine kinase PhoR